MDERGMGDRGAEAQVGGLGVEGSFILTVTEMKRDKNQVVSGSVSIVSLRRM